MKLNFRMNKTLIKNKIQHKFNSYKNVNKTKSQN